MFFFFHKVIISLIKTTTIRVVNILTAGNNVEDSPDLSTYKSLQINIYC